MNMKAMKQVCAFLLCASSALTISSALADPAPDLPALKTQNGVSYLSGGIGEDQVAAIKAAAPGYALLLTFAGSDGAYLADVTVTIQDSKGVTVLDTIAQGPLLLAQLPPGQYRLTAQYQGNAQTKKLSVKKHATTRVTLRWPS